MTEVHPLEREIIYNYISITGGSYYRKAVILARRLEKCIAAHARPRTDLPPPALDDPCGRVPGREGKPRPGYLASANPLPHLRAYKQFASWGPMARVFAPSCTPYTHPIYPLLPCRVSFFLINWRGRPRVGVNASRMKERKKDT